MGLKDKLLLKKKKMQEQMQRGRVKSEQLRAERLRKKRKRLTDMKPGTLKAMRSGMAMKKKPFQIMQEEYERRKTNRESKACSKKNRSQDR